MILPHTTLLFSPLSPLLGDSVRVLTNTSEGILFQPLGDSFIWTIQPMPIFEKYLLNLISHGHQRESLSCNEAFPTGIGYLLPDRSLKSFPFILKTTEIKLENMVIMWFTWWGLSHFILSFSRFIYFYLGKGRGQGRVF